MKRVIFCAALATILLSSCHKETFDEKVARETEDFNQKEAPKRVDKYTMLDSMNWNPKSRTITYYYSMEGDVDNDSLITDEVKTEFREQLLKSVKGSIQLKPYKEQGLKFAYCYLSKKSGKVLYETKFTKKDY